ncbi:hypothetical protein SAMN04487944_108111 [Gracilibacillus ureilyticus]|uniref:Uncharacterized protein n=1 Tax=Gracilibacillus ureilyticus TaxID=531814 RepID=A0A1H9RCH9_9BACI|nr:hypothetical protein [Gracilibacillus ureilyticus]SER70368.1 hypothetical protein SAMN04487944_108111 [Gracilibacillus ureilyticus]
MSYKLFTSVFLVLVIAVLLAIGGFNYWIDPLWTFSHSHENNDVQFVIDERQQKVNQLYYGKSDYDTLLIGSSRTTYIPAEEFTGMDVYNFAASDLSFLEYEAMIDFAKEQKGSEFERIIIGVDFFKSSLKESTDPVSLEPYTEKVKEPFYRWKNLLSLDVLEYARKNYRLSQNDQIVDLRNYNRENTAFAKHFELGTIEEETKAKIYKFRQQFYGENYQYNKEMKSVLQHLKEENPDTEFVIFTTPISAPLYRAMIEEGNEAGYERWLDDLVDVFGGVHHFMYPNSVTEDLSNYFDGHHFYPEVGKLIAKRISEENPAEVPEDFGIYLTKE